LNLVGYVRHEEAISYQRRSQLLLLIEIDSKESRCIIPGKLFEYMAAHRPIVALGPEGSDVERILKETNTGHYFGYEDHDEIKKLLISHFKAFQNNTLKSHPVGIQKYHRRALTEQLARLISNT
jgi:glycosyltransferase involved in cell wall biosynthesis